MEHLMVWQAHCMEACEQNQTCQFINFAEATNHACYLFASCSHPWHDTPLFVIIRNS
jgi:hypothetical protein